MSMTDTRYKEIAALVAQVQRDGGFPPGDAMTSPGQDLPIGALLAQSPDGRTRFLAPQIVGAILGISAEEWVTHVFEGVRRIAAGLPVMDPDDGSLVATKAGVGDRMKMGKLARKTRRTKGW